MNVYTKGGGGSLFGALLVRTHILRVTIIEENDLYIDFFIKENII